METKYIIFTLGEQQYGIRLEKINGIEQEYNIVPIPVGTRLIKGIIHLREEVIPIFDLKGMFGCYDGLGENSQLLVTETHNMKIGIEVDKVIGIIEVENKDIKRVPPVVKAEDTAYIENIVKIASAQGYGKDDEIVLAISIDNIMTDEEFEDIAHALEENEQEDE